MEQLKQIGEVLGGLRALMIFRDEIKINQRQCALLFDAFNLAFDSISQEMIKHAIKLAERRSKWKPLEGPLRELHRVFREGECYIRGCLDAKDWLGRAISLNHNTDCVDLHVHNLLWCVPVVLEAIEDISAGEMSKAVVSKKYDGDWIDPTVFEHEFGRAYLISPEMRRRLDSAFREDRWLLSEYEPLTKQEDRLRELLMSPKGTIFPCSVLVGSQDYHVRRRLGGTGTTRCKEIQWMGESFAMRHAIGEGEVERLMGEASLHSSLAHPNVMSYAYAFRDEERGECFVVMELMSKDLSSYVKEVCGPRKRTVPFPPLVAVDLMLQIARGMEYLHSKGVGHGDLNPSNVLVNARCTTASPDGGCVQVKVANFGRSTHDAGISCIWRAPEVLAEEEQSSAQDAGGSGWRRGEKADVYSFAMICFELLTGKVPFEESHLQGEKMGRNIRAGERPLFPFPCPKYLASLTRRCWHADPGQRPGFCSIARVLRYVKRFLVMNPDLGQGEPPNTPVDYFDVETCLMKRLSSWGRMGAGGVKVSDVPFQMYAYRAIERERAGLNLVKERSLDSGSEGASVSSEDSPSNHVSPVSSVSNGGSDGGKKGSSAKKGDAKARQQTGQQQKAKTARPTQLAAASCGGALVANSGNHLLPVAAMSPGGRRTPTSDAELS